MAEGTVNISGSIDPQAILNVFLNRGEGVAEVKMLFMEILSGLKDRIKFEDVTFSLKDLFPEIPEEWKEDLQRVVRDWYSKTKKTLEKTQQYFINYQKEVFKDIQDLKKKNLKILQSLTVKIPKIKLPEVDNVNLKGINPVHPNLRNIHNTLIENAENRRSVMEKEKIVDVRLVSIDPKLGFTLKDILKPKEEKKKEEDPKKQKDSLDLLPRLVSIITAGLVGLKLVDIAKSLPIGAPRSIIGLLGKWISMFTGQLIDNLISLSTKVFKKSIERLKSMVGDVIKNIPKFLSKLVQPLQKGFTFFIDNIFKRFPTILKNIFGSVGSKLGSITKIGAGGVNILSKLKPIGKLLLGRLKAMPILGAFVGIGLGIDSIKKGDLIGGLGEMASGLSSLLPPPFGIAISLAIDALLIKRQLSNTPDQIKQQNMNFNAWLSKIRDLPVIKHFIHAGKALGFLFKGDFEGALKEWEGASGGILSSILSPILWPFKTIWNLGKNIKDKLAVSENLPDMESFYQSFKMQIRKITDSAKEQLEKWKGWFVDRLEEFNKGFKNIWEKTKQTYRKFFGIESNVLKDYDRNQIIEPEPGKAQQANTNLGNISHKEKSKNVKVIVELDHQKIDKSNNNNAIINGFNSLIKAFNTSEGRHQETNVILTQLVKLFQEQLRQTLPRPSSQVVSTIQPPKPPMKLTPIPLEYGSKSSVNAWRDTIRMKVR